MELLSVSAKCLQIDVFEGLETHVFHTLLRPLPLLEIPKIQQCFLWLGEKHSEALATLKDLTPESIEALLRSLAEEKQVGLGKIAQPLRVAICGNTISPPIFDAVDMLGINAVLKRIENTLTTFQQEKD